jgi:hypothetical protein
MATPDLVIGIGAEYIGKPAFDKANKSISGLDKSVAKLGKTFAGLFAAQKLISYGRASVQAFNADNQSAKRLTATLDSLGLAFEDSRVKTLIGNMEKTYKVADDQLRPAMQSLLQVTGSVSKSQSILETALNASAGSGTDLATTTQDLAQAYVGNLKGLKKYNLGLTNAELAGKSFAQIQDLINQKFKGQAAIKAADPMNQLALAADNAKETIGKGLVDAINSAVGAGTGLNDISSNMDTLAKSTAGVIKAIGSVAGFVAYGVKGLVNSGAATKELLTGKSNPQMARGQYARGGGKAIDTAAAKRAQSEKEQIARNKEIAKLMQAQAVQAALAAKAKKEAAILEKANQLFNIDLIQNIAALQGKVSEEDRLRLKTQQELLLGNAQSAGELAMKLLEVQKQAMLARQADPFLGWTDSTKSALDAIQKMIDALKNLGIAQQMVGYSPTISTAAGTFYTTSTGVKSTSPSIGTSYGYFAGTAAGKYGSTSTYTPTSVDVNLNIVNGNLTADLQNQSVTGTPASLSRINPINNG